MERSKNNPVLEKTFQFALKIVKFCDELDKHKRFAISNQLIRSGTSIGANVREAQSSHSRTDFAAKMIIAAKEAEETEYWILISKESEGYPNPEGLEQDIIEIKKLLFSIIGKSKR